MAKFKMFPNLKLVCRVIAVISLIYGVTMFVFHLSTFASPNFAALVNLQMLPETTSTFGRMWYSLANIAFWITYMMATTLIFLATNWKVSKLLEPFFQWSAVSIAWDLLLVAFKIAYYQGTRSVIIILWKLISMALTACTVAVMYKYGVSIADNEGPEEEPEDEKPDNFEEQANSRDPDSIVTIDLTNKV